MGRRIHACHVRRRIHIWIAMSACIRTCECVYGEEDTCLSCEEEDTYLDRRVSLCVISVWRRIHACHVRRRIHT
jgi:hypothetical protein